MQFGGTGTLPMPEISWFVCDQAVGGRRRHAFQGTDPVAEGFGRHAGGSAQPQSNPALVDEFLSKPHPVETATERRDLLPAAEHADPG